MEENCDLAIFRQCRLCGVHGHHEMDILDNDLNFESHNSNELSKKIFRSVGIQVERSDKITTKICGNCVRKVNEIVVFRKICAATDIQLRNAVLNGSEELIAAALDDLDAVQQLVGPSSRADRLKAMQREIANMDSSDSETGQRDVSQQSTKHSSQLETIENSNGSAIGEQVDDGHRHGQLSTIAVGKKPDLTPLAELSLTHTRTVCVGGEMAGTYGLRKCFDEFSPNISAQVKQMPEINRLQKVVWPHLLEGGSAIIIEASDYLADLVYLPVICTHVQKMENDTKRIGPWVIIVCKSQQRCDEIAERCIAYSLGGYMAKQSVCTSNSNTFYVADENFLNCKIFVTTAIYFTRYGFNRLGRCNSVQKIVFDRVDMRSGLFDILIRKLDQVSSQIIISWACWRKSHRLIYLSGNRDFVIFGAPLDVAIAAGAELDVIFAQRAILSKHTSKHYKLGLMLGKIESMPEGTSIIVCHENADITKLKDSLNQRKIHFDVVISEQNDGNITALYHFTHAGRDVYFCVARLLPLVDLSDIKYFFIYKSVTNLDRPEIEFMIGKFQSIIKPATAESRGTTTAVILLLSFQDDGEEPRALATSLMNYNHYFRCCPNFWAFVRQKNLLPIMNRSLH